ncbi:MAG: diguanylate cyclase [Devosia sp.]|nr:diguanylate cyclase [Devosia sp.]
MMAPSVGTGASSLMAATTDGLFPIARPRRNARPASLSAGIIVLVFFMVAIVATGFAFIDAQQRALDVHREAAESMRTTLDLLTEADSIITRLAVGDEAASLTDYYGALEALGALSAANMPLLDPYLAGETGALAAAQLLESDWTEAVRLASMADLAGARALLIDRDTGGLVRELRDAEDNFLEQWTARFSIYEERIAIGTWVVLLLQVAGGTLAIVGLIHAYRLSRVEANGRAAAVAYADASRDQVKKLFDMADVLQVAADHTDANAVLRATAADLVPGFPGALYIFNNSRDRLVLTSFWDRGTDQPLPETIPPSQCWALKRGKPHLNHANGSKLCCDHHSTGDAVLEIPMMARGEFLGLLQLFARGDEAEARLLAVENMGAALADGMSLALANIALREKLRNQALRDPLTGLYNRRYMEDTLTRFVRLAEREQRTLSVIMIDLDNFKRLNDEHGHAMGDAVLRETASTIVSSLRETDVACRYGGEELIVILPDCELDKAAEKAELLRLRIESLSATHNTAISASFGVASIPHTSHATTDLLAAADAALYRAKQGGRNCVMKAPRRIGRPELAHDDVIELMPRQAAE